MNSNKNAKVISIINMKGGVGKTTLSIGLADFLSEINYKILIIDADPQFNATQALLDEYKTPKQNEDSENNFYTNEIFNKQKTISRLFKARQTLDYDDNIIKDCDVVINLKENLDILCGDLTLVLANKSSDYALVKKIRNFIYDNKLRTKYDYIFIDCPPTLTIYTDSALMASDYYLIPNRIDRYSIVGIESLQKAVNNLIREEKLNLKCIGLVYTIVNLKNSKKQDKIKQSFESKDVVNNINIFNAVCSEQRNIQVGSSGSLPTKYKSSKEDIEAVCYELLEKIKRCEMED